MDNIIHRCLLLRLLVYNLLDEFIYNFALNMLVIFIPNMCCTTNEALVILCQKGEAGNGSEGGDKGKGKRKAESEPIQENKDQDKVRIAAKQYK